MRIEILYNRKDLQGRTIHRSPDVCHGLIVGEAERAVEAAQRHVVLARVEAAQPHVVPHLRVVHAHLQQSPVVPDGHLGLGGRGDKQVGIVVTWEQPDNAHPVDLSASTGETKLTWSE